MLGHTLGLAGDGPHQDEAAANLKVLVGLTSNKELATGVDVEDAVILLRSDILDVAERDNSRVGAHNVEPAKPFLALTEELLDLADITHVGLDGHRIPAELLDGLHNIVGRDVAGGVVDNHPGTTTC